MAWLKAWNGTRYSTRLQAWLQTGERTRSATGSIASNNARNLANYWTVSLVTK